MKKRFLSILVTAAMLLSLLPMAAFAEGNAGPQDGPAVAQVGTTEYDALEDAIAAAKHGGTVTLLQNVTNYGFVTENGENLTLDLNGHTYCINGPVGSAGTVTNGLQLKKGSTVLIKNGTIEGSAVGIKILIKNYSDLTLDNVVLKAENVSSQTVVNTGKLIIKGEDTVIEKPAEVSWAITTGNYEHDDVITTEIIAGTIDGVAIETPVWETGGATVNESVTVTIKGGYISEVGEYDWRPEYGDQYKDAPVLENAKMIITGGTYSSDPSAYLEEGYIATEGSDGKFAVEALTSRNAAAKIGSKYYATLADAVAAADNGDTVTLLQNVEDQAKITVDKKITLDLNGHDIGFAANSSRTDNYFYVNGGELNFIGNGKVHEKAGGYFYAPVIVVGSPEASATNYSVVTVGKDVTLEGYDGLTVDNTGANDAYAYGVDVTVNGTLSGKADSDGYGGVGLYVSGNIKETSGNVPKISIGNTAILCAEAGEAEEPYGTSVGMYLAGYADTTIAEGASIQAKNGVEIRAGKLHVTGGEITGTGTPTTTTPNGNGTTTSGAGIAVVQHTTKLPISVDISGGTVSGFTGLYEEDAQGNDAAAIEKVSIQVTGGNFAATNGGSNAVYSENDRLTISGGNFTSDPTDYLTDNKMVVPGSLVGYAFSVGDKVETEVVPAVGAPAVDEEKITLPEEVKETAIEVAKSAEADSTVLAAAANTAVSKISETEKAAAQAAIEAENSGVTVAPGNEITIYAQTYLDIIPTAYETDKNILTLEIQPMYRVVASTADTAGGIEVVNETEETPNAVVLENSEKPLTNIKTLPISVTLPSGFSTDNLIVKHEASSGTYYYEPTVTESNGKKVATFTVTHGFSPFTFLADEREVTVKFGEDAAETTLKATDVGDTLPTATSSGKRFGGWQFEGISGTYTTLTDELLTALFEKYDGTTIVATPYFYTSSGGGSSTTYAINIEKTSHGTVTASSKTAASGRIVTLTVKPDEGYVLDELTVTDAKGKDLKLNKKSSTSYTFEMPAGAVTVQAVFEKGVSQRPADAYTDVSENAWYYEAVDSVLTSGMMSGTSATTFAPNATLTRAMVVQTLWAAQGKPVVNYLMTYDDVAGSDWYAESIRWAASERIVSGYSDAKFGPNDPVTREQLMVMLYAYAKSEGKGFTGSWMFQLGYTDTAQVSQWAYEAACWCTTNGVVSGKTGNLLDPQGTATRAEAAQMLVNFMQALEA